MSECRECAIYNIGNRTAWMVGLVAVAALCVMLLAFCYVSRWWAFCPVGVILPAAFLLAAASDKWRYLHVADTGLYVSTVFRRHRHGLAWESIEKVIVTRTRDGHTIKRVLIVGRNPRLPLEAVYDEKRGTLFEPLGRRMIAIHGNAPDLNAVLQRLQDRVPNAFPNGA